VPAPVPELPRHRAGAASRQGHADERQRGDRGDSPDAERPSRRAHARPPLAWRWETWGATGAFGGTGEATSPVIQAVGIGP
jgi:hypothetical protein